MLQCFADESKQATDSGVWHFRGIVVALAMGERNDEMLAKAVKAFMLVLSVVLMSSAFLPLSTPNPARSLMLLGAGLVSLGTVTRRHFADE